MKTKTQKKDDGRLFFASCAAMICLGSGNNNGNGSWQHDPLGPLGWYWTQAADRGLVKSSVALAMSLIEEIERVTEKDGSNK